MKVSTKFKVDTIIHCLVITLFLLIRYVTLWPWHLTFWPWSVVIHGRSRGRPPHQVWRSYGYPFLSYEFWHLPYDTIHNAFAATAHAPYHVTYAWRQIFSRICEICDPDLPIRNATFMALRLRQMEVLAKTVHGPVLKITQRSAHAQNRVSVQRCRNNFTTIVLGVHDFPLTGSNVGNLTAFRAIFTYIFTAHAQKRLFMNFRLKFWHHRSIPWPRFPYRARYFRDLRTFSVDFCIA